MAGGVACPEVQDHQEGHPVCGGGVDVRLRHEARSHVRGFDRRELVLCLDGEAGFGEYHGGVRAPAAHSCKLEGRRPVELLAEPLEQMVLQVALRCTLPEPAIFPADDVRWGAVTDVVGELHQADEHVHQACPLRQRVIPQLLPDSVEQRPDDLI
jgi:hypothetical protein